MKRTVGHLLAFGYMTAFCTVLLLAAILFVRMLAAFVVWSLDPLTFTASGVFLALRLIVAISAFIGVWFTFSKDGQEVVEAYVKEGL